MRKIVLVTAACLLTSPAFATREPAPEKQVFDLSTSVMIQPQLNAPTLLGYQGFGEGVMVLAKNDKDKCSVVSPSKPCKGNNGFGNGGGDGSPNGKPDGNR